jgi:hypothetical protein
MIHPKGSLALANNGWIWANNPLEDFAGPQSRAYLRREVIVWGDCVKLRYGRGPVFSFSTVLTNLGRQPLDMETYDTVHSIDG